MKRSRGIALGVAMLTTAASAWFGCSSGGNNNNNSTSSSTGTGTGVSTGSSTGSGTSSTGTSSSTGSGSTSSGTSTSSSTGTGGGGSDAGDGGPSFATSVYTPWIEPHCVGCHHSATDPGFDAAGGGVLYGNLDMGTVDAAFANLVNIPAQGVLPPFEDAGQIACDTVEDGSAGHLRVEPGVAAQSLLCLKLKGFLTDGSVPCGIPMPASGELPDGGQQAAFTAVQQWINGGALP